MPAVDIGACHQRSISGYESTLASLICSIAEFITQHFSHPTLVATRPPSRCTRIIPRKTSVTTSIVDLWPTRSRLYTLTLTRHNSQAWMEGRRWLGWHRVMTSTGNNQLRGNTWTVKLLEGLQVNYQITKPRDQQTCGQQILAACEGWSQTRHTPTAWLLPPN